MGIPDDATSRRAPDGMSVWSGHGGFGQSLRGIGRTPPGIPTPRVQTAQKPIRRRRRRRSDAAASYGVVRRALRLGAARGLPRLRCREFRAEELLESLDPSRVRRVDLRFNNLGWAGLSVVLPRLSRFPELRGLRLPYGNADARRATPGSAAGIRCLAAHLGTLPGLRELNLGSSRLSGNLRPILRALPAPLESLELPFCSLLPADLAFLSRSSHAPALRRLDLSGHDFSSRGLLEPLRLLLERSSASLLLLDLSECRLADAQLDALLPALRRCSRLRFLGLRGNSLSAAALRELLRETLELPDLRLVVYPGADDCDSWDSVPDESEFSRILADSGRSDAVWTRNPYGRHEGLDYFSL